MKGFKTIKISDEFIPEISEFPEFDGKTLISSSERSHRSGKIFFMPSALKDLDAHIHWGERRHDNLVEQGGYMIGNVYRDSKTNTLFAIVSCLVPVHGAEGTEAFLDMGTDASYDATLRENEILQEDNNIRRVGWYHTHPGGLGVFMSGTDMQTQTKSYFHDWQFAVVLNPQKQIWRGFRGARAAEVDCIMVCDKNDSITSKFIQKPQYYNNYGWNPKYDYDYSYDERYNQTAAQSHKQSPVNQKKPLFVRLNGENIYIGDCIMAIDTFMSRLYNSIAIGETTTKPDSISLDLLLRIQIEESQLEFFTITCTNHTVNITEKEQIITKFEVPDIDMESQHDLVHAIVHYKDTISEEESVQMAELYNFTSDSEIFCIFSRVDDGIVRFYVCDHDRNDVMGELTYK